MLASQLGIRLVLWVGRTVPAPAPAEAMLALRNIEVTHDVQTGDGFQITFAIGRDQRREFTLLRHGLFDSFNRVVIGVLIGVTPEVLMNGVITHQQVAPSNEPGRSILTVTGKDISVLMDLKEKNRDHKNMPDDALVTRVLTEYAGDGLTGPHAIKPTQNVPVEVRRVVQQHETDLRFIRELARRNGFVFYVEPVTFGVSAAYWGPPSRVGMPQPALSVNLGPHSNVESLDFAEDALAPVGTEGSFVEPVGKNSLPIPGLPSLRVPPLAANATEARRTVVTRQTANREAGEAAVAALAATTNTPDAVAGQGQLRTVRYGHVLRARRLVGVRGAGLAHDGVYYVRHVTHSIAPGEYTQRFTLGREGKGTLLQVLPV